MTDGTRAPGASPRQTRAARLCTTWGRCHCPTSPRPEGNYEGGRSLRPRVCSRGNSPGTVVAHDGTEASRPEEKVTKTEREDTGVTATVSTVGMGTRLHVRPGVPRTWGAHAQSSCSTGSLPREPGLQRWPAPRCGHSAAARSKPPTRGRWAWAVGASGTAIRPARQDRGWHSALQHYLLKGSGLPKTPTRASSTFLCPNVRTHSRDNGPDRERLGNK